jgi:hypothetical protein
MGQSPILSKGSLTLWAFAWVRLLSPAIKVLSMAKKFEDRSLNRENIFPTDSFSMLLFHCRPFGRRLRGKKKFCLSTPVISRNKSIVNG